MTAGCTGGAPCRLSTAPRKVVAEALSTSHHRPLPQASSDRETSCSRLPNGRCAMSNIGSKNADDTVAGCRARATADRASAASAETTNVRSKFEQSASRWDERAGFLGRMVASFAKREKLDAARKAFNGVGSAKRLAQGPLAGEVAKTGSVRAWENEGGSVLTLSAARVRS